MDSGAALARHARTLAAMARVLVFAAIAATVLAVFAVVDCALTERHRIRGLPRWAWIVVAIVLPVAGPLLWLLVGRGPAARRVTTRVMGPEDDPDFLRPRRPLPPPPDDTARWEQLEQELANLDSDADDDGDGTRR
jgi:hypothetical protein